MIRISIFFLAFFSISTLPYGWSQDGVLFNCYNLDSISWDLEIQNCPGQMVDSFHILTRSDQNSEFTKLFTGTDPAIRGYRNDAFKSDQAVLLQYFTNCPALRIIQSDTLSLPSLRQAVELDSVRVLVNGDVELTWKEKPVSGVKYVVNAAVQGSSQVLASNIQGNTYTDTRGLANREIEYYSISAALDCGYTFPEPDSFYHTSLLSYEMANCGGEITFDFIPFSYWKDGTTNAQLFVIKNGQLVDSVTLSPGQSSFTYVDLENSSTYSFYVRESGNQKEFQFAYSNPITINTHFYEPIRWVVIDEITFDDQDKATISWTTNDHPADTLFQLTDHQSTVEIPRAALIFHPGAYRYSYRLPDFPAEMAEYSLSLQDSCGNMVQSLYKRPLLSQGQLNGGTNLNIEWTDVADEEWTINSYDIFYETNGAFSKLGSVNGTTNNFQYKFDENNPLDSVCYYIIANGEVYYSGMDSTTILSIRSNTVCLHGETLIQLPNAYSSNQNPYRPIIIPNSNIASYAFRVFDRYGNLIFESHDPTEGWDGRHQGKTGFMDVYVVQVEMTNSQGEKISKSGSVLLFP